MYTNLQKSSAVLVKHKSKLNTHSSYAGLKKCPASYNAKRKR